MRGGQPEDGCSQLWKESPHEIPPPRILLYSDLLSAGAGGAGHFLHERNRHRPSGAAVGLQAQDTGSVHDDSGAIEYRVATLG